MTVSEVSGVDQLREEGYAHIPQAIDDRTLKSMRDAAEAFSFRNDGVGLAVGITMAIPGLESVVFAKSIVDLAHELLGERISFFPNVTLRRNSQTPWHVDDAFRLPFDGWDDADRIQFLQVTVYLQSNGETGGGLDVVPRSHRLAERAGAAGSIQALITTMLADAVKLPSKAGDAVLWDGRLMHRSTPWVSPPRSPNLAIHWTFSREDADRIRFFDHLVARGNNQKDTTGVDRRYGEMQVFSFQRAASKEFLSQAAAAGVTLFDAACADAQRERSVLGAIYGPSLAVRLLG